MTMEAEDFGHFLVLSSYREGNLGVVGFCGRLGFVKVISAVAMC